MTGNTPAPEHPGLDHPEEPILRFFAWAHLPQKLQDVSRPFGELALWLVDNLPRTPERTVALRKLLEGKDAAVRAALPPAPAYPLIAAGMPDGPDPSRVGWMDNPMNATPEGRPIAGFGGTDTRPLADEAGQP